MVLTSVAALGILTPSDLTIGWIGPNTVLIAVLYVAAMAWLRRAPVPARVGHSAIIPLEQPVGLGAEAPLPRWSAPTRFAIAAIGILIAAPMVALSAKQIAEESGVGQTLVGSTLVAVSTSLPELVVALAAVRIGAHDLAVGNLFGSNAANMSVLLILDAVYTDGPILSAIDPTQAVAAVGAILLMALAVAALVGGTETRVRRMEPDAIVLLVAYLGVLAAIAVAGA
jgi:cation:H+ antiporter